MDVHSEAHEKASLTDRIAEKITKKLNEADSGLMYVPVEGMEVTRDGVVDTREHRNEALLRHADHASKGERKM